jgi:transcriptional regulator with XRE-family HTH domain
MVKFSTLKTIREAQRETMQSMAEKLGVSQARYYYMETGQRPISAEYVDKICAVLKIKPKEKMKIFLPKVFTVCDKD